MSDELESEAGRADDEPKPQERTPGDEIREAIANAEKVEAPPKNKGKGKKAASGISYQNAAKRITLLAPYVEDRNGNLWKWNGRHYEEITKDTLGALAFEATDRQGLERGCREIAFLVRKSVHKADLKWGQVGDHEVPVENGVLDVISGELRRHRPEDYLENVIPHKFVESGIPAQMAPTFFDALVTWFGEDIQAVDAFQEFAGYVLLPHARFKKALLLYGPGDTGKSQAAYILQALVGAALCCQLSIENMDNVQLRSVLVGKRLNIMSELSQKAFMADSGFKTLVSTEEPVMVDIKYKPTFMYRPTAKHVIATNNAPRVTARTEEIFNRFLIVPMFNVVPLQDQDRDLQAKLDAEMPGIFLWALEGAKRLNENGGQFTSVSSGEQVLAEWKAELNPMTTYLPENMRFEPGARTPLAAIAADYRRKTKRKADSRQVGKWLRDMGFKVKTARPTTEGRQAMKCLVDWTFAKAVEEFTEDDLSDGFVN